MINLVSDNVKILAGIGAVGVLIFTLATRTAAAQPPPIAEPEPEPIPQPDPLPEVGPVMAELGDIEAKFISKIGTSTGEEGRRAGADIVNNSDETITFHVAFASVGPSGLVTSRDSINLVMEPGEEITVIFDDFFTEGKPAGSKYQSTISFTMSSQDQTPILAPIISNFNFR